MRWEVIVSGLIAVLLVGIIGIVLASSGNGIWLTAFLPLAMVAAGALVLGGFSSDG